MERPVSHSFDVGHVAQRLAAGNGGYEIVHETDGVEVGVYVLVAPEPDRQQPHEWDEIYVVLEGNGVLTVEDEDITLAEGGAVEEAHAVRTRCEGREGLGGRMGMHGLHDVFLVVRNGYCGRGVDHTRGRETAAVFTERRHRRGRRRRGALAVRDGGDAGEAGGADEVHRHVTAPFCSRRARPR